LLIFGLFDGGPLLFAGVLLFISVSFFLGGFFSLNVHYFFLLNEVTVSRFVEQGFMRRGPLFPMCFFLVTPFLSELFCSPPWMVSPMSFENPDENLGFAVRSP